MVRQLDIASNRSSLKYGRSEMLARIAWMFAGLLFRFSPRPMFGCRAWLLRRFGATIGKSVHLYPSATIYYPWNLVIGDESSVGEHALIYNLGPCEIGARVTISQRTHLCGGSHDYTDPTMPLQRLPIEVRNDAWVCADAFIGPGVVVGRGAVVGARAVVTRDVDEWTVVAGNPAVVVRQREMKGESHD